MAELFTNPRLFDPRQQALGQLFGPPEFVGKRPSVLPLPMKQRSGEREWTAPQWLVDMTNSALLPGAAAKGYRASEGDARQLVADISVGGGLFGRAPAGSFASGVRKIDAPYSNYKVDPALPKDLDAGLSVNQTSAYGPEKSISPEKLQRDGYLLNLVGDRSNVGEITRLGGETLSTPITLDGGRGYMRGKDTGAWASDQRVINSLAKRVKDADGRPVYGTYMPMGGTATDFAEMTRAVALRNFDPKNLRKKDTKEFDARFKKNKGIEGKLREDFPGIASPELGAWLDKSGTRRSAFFDFMDKTEWRDKGFPNVTNARHAIQDPALRDMPGGVEQYGGQAISLMDSAGKTTPVSDLSMSHGTYGMDLDGKYLGGFPSSVPRSVLFPEWYGQRRASGGLVSGDNRAFQMTPVLQKTNDEWLDSVMKHIESNPPR